MNQPHVKTLQEVDMIGSLDHDELSNTIVLISIMNSLEKNSNPHSFFKKGLADLHPLTIAKQNYTQAAVANAKAQIE